MVHSERGTHAMYRLAHLSKRGWGLSCPAPERSVERALLGETREKSYLGKGILAFPK